MPVREPLQRLRQVARRPAPVVGLARPPQPLLTALGAAAEEAAASATELALLEAGPRDCGALLAELAEHERRAERATAQVRGARGSDLDCYLATASALADVTGAVHDAGAWWCRSSGCDPAADGLAAALRDATRELARGLATLPEYDDEAVVAVHRRVREGRHLARRARAAAIERGELHECLGRTNAIAGVERALASVRRAAIALQRLTGREGLSVQRRRADHAPAQ